MAGRISDAELHRLIEEGRDRVNSSARKGEDERMRLIVGPRMIDMLEELQRLRDEKARRDRGWAI